MKKIIALLGASIMMLAVSPVAFAANLDFSGKMDSQLIYGQNPTFGHNWDGKADLELEASLGDSIKGGVSIRDMERFFTGDWFHQDDELPVTNPGIDLDSLWMQSQGALWNNGPEFTTRIGGLDVSYSNYIADVTDPGISIAADFGKVSLGAFNAWTEETRNPGHGLNATLKPAENVELGGTYVKVEGQQSFAIDGTVKATDATTLDAVFASVHDGGEAIKFGANHQLNQNVSLRASYRDFGPDFSPIWRNDEDFTDIQGLPDFDADENPVDYYNGEKGFNFGATAQVAGFTVEGDLDMYEQQLTGEDNAELSASVARDFELVGNKFTAKLSGAYDFESDQREELDANLKYNAPNGLSLEVNHDFEAKETTAGAGFSMEF